MAVSTRSSFFLSQDVEDNITQYLNFNEGAGELTATLDVGSYAPNELRLEAQRQMSSVGQDYTITLDRSTKLYTVSASSNFDILVTTGSNASSTAWGLLGFTSDKTGSNSYTSDTTSFTEYRPQFWLQDYTSSDDWIEAVDEKINESASGVIEVVKFGEVRRTEFNIMYITNYTNIDPDVLEVNASAISQAQAFLSHLINKNHVEFMVNRDLPDSYETLLLEQTSISQSGTGFKLREMVSQRLAGYYSTGNLIFRVI